jgi:hypothetical protein
MLAPHTVVVEHVIGSMAEIPKHRRAIYLWWWRSARGGNQRWWGAQAPDRVSVYGGVEYGACRRPKKMACVIEKKTVVLHGDRACSGGGVMSQGRSGGHGDEDDGTSNTLAMASEVQEEALFGDTEEGALLQEQDAQRE